METWVRESRKALTAKPAQPLGPKPDLPSNPYDNPQAPTTLYNGMIHALTPLAIRGAIWYQGENNRNDGLFYEKKMAALIQGWRTVWQLGDFPFYYVQLAPYNYGYNRETPTGDIPDFLRLPYIWEAQMNALRIPNTGMAVITDITNLNDIHPANKKDVGYRLSLWARANTYGEKTLVYSGPLYKSMTVDGNRSASPSTTSEEASSRTTASRSSGSRSPARTISSTKPRPRSPGTRSSSGARASRRRKPSASAGTSWPCRTWPTRRACRLRPSVPTAGN